MEVVSAAVVVVEVVPVVPGVAPVAEEEVPVVGAVELEEAVVVQAVAVAGEPPRLDDSLGRLVAPLHI